MAKQANLLQYYKPFPEGSFSGEIQFFEIMKIALAMYASNVEYSLVNVKGYSVKSEPIDLDRDRVFLRQDF